MRLLTIYTQNINQSLNQSCLTDADRLLFCCLFSLRTLLYTVVTTTTYNLQEIILNVCKERALFHEVSPTTLLLPYSLQQAGSSRVWYIGKTQQSEQQYRTTFRSDRTNVHHKQGDGKNPPTGAGPILATKRSQPPHAVFHKASVPPSPHGHNIFIWSWLRMPNNKNNNHGSRTAFHPPRGALFPPPPRRRQSSLTI